MARKQATKKAAASTKKGATKRATKATTKAKSTDKPAKAEAGKNGNSTVKSHKISQPPFPIKSPKQKHYTTLTNDASQGKKRSLNKKFLETQKQKLLELRDHILDQMQGVAQDNLRAKSDGAASSAFGMHQADAGSDAYEKDFALSLLSQEQDALYEIEEALKRIELGKYGVCEISNEPIPVERLEAIPFARYTVKCQSEIEMDQKGKGRWDTAPQFMESTDHFYEEDDDRDFEDRPKIKD